MAEVATKDSVGRQFTRAYYTAFCKQLENLYQFYDEDASFLWAEEAVVEEATVGKSAIGKKIESLRSLVGDAPQIKLVVMDFQNSVNGGISVLVVGHLLNPTNQRKFVQTFFLARQGTSYAIANDVLRFLSGNLPEGSATAQRGGQKDVAPAKRENKQVAPQEQPKDKRKQSAAAKKAKKAKKEEKEEKEEEKEEKEEASAPPPKREAAKAPAKPEPVKNEEPAAAAPSGVLSYSSMAKRGINAPPPVVPQAEPLPVESPAASAPTAPPSGAAAAAQGGSVVVKNIPETQRKEDVAALFSSFGKIVSITLKSNKSSSVQYCFIDFADKEAADKCLAASGPGMQLGGVSVKVEPKHARNKPYAQNNKRRGRGRGEGRGRGPRTNSDGFTTQGRRN